MAAILLGEGHSTLKPHGHIVVTDDMGRETVVDTRSCPHCGAHWIYSPGSGRPHKFCTNCNALTCSRKECIENCTAVEKWMETVEKQWERMNRSWW